MAEAGVVRLEPSRHDHDAVGARDRQWTEDPVEQAEDAGAGSRAEGEGVNTAVATKSGTRAR
jgi:hypothetical protein